MQKLNPARAPVIVAAALLGAAVSVPLAAHCACAPQGKPVTFAIAACSYGAPVVVGTTLLLAKACRIPLGADLMDRHSIEVRDARTGAKRGQTSLPAVKVAKGAARPVVGGLIGGAFPLYVFRGGIAAVDVTKRKAELVLQSEGALIAAMRYGEVLAVADGLAKSPTFPAGAVEWTIVDFGSSELLGQTRIAGTAVDAIGLGREGGALVAWLARAGKAGPVQVWAAVRGADGKPISKDGNLHAKLRPAPAANSKTRVAPVSGSACVAFAGNEPILVGAPPLRLDGASAVVMATAATPRLGGVPGCVAAATPADGKTWAWVVSGGRAGLQALKCAVPKAAPLPKAPPPKAAKTARTAK